MTNARCTFQTLLVSFFLLLSFSPPSQAQELIGHRYQIIGDGSIVRDVVENLEWQRCSVGQSWNGTTCVGDATRYTHGDATELQAPEGFALPTIEQLRSIVYCSNTGQYDSNGTNDRCDTTVTYDQPTLNSEIFPNTSSFTYWSSLINESDTTQAMGVNFFFGDVTGSHALYASLMVRFVRVVEVPTFELSVAKNGSGSVSSDVTGINCGEICSYEFDLDTEVTLTAAPAEGFEFSSWSGCDSSVDENCTVAMNAAKAVTVTFEEVQDASPTPINDRYQAIEGGAVVRDLVSGLEWQRCSVGQTWNGTGCDGTATYHVWADAVNLVADGGFVLPTRDQMRTIVYCSNIDQYNANADGEECGVFGTYDVPTIDIAAFPDTLADFYWTADAVGDVFPNDAWYTYFNVGVIAEGDKTQDFSARLVRESTATPTELTVVKTGTGEGSVISDPAGISCGESCSANFNEGAAVTLTATAGTGSEFAGWEGCASTTETTCTVVMDAVKSVTATFNQVDGGGGGDTIDSRYLVIGDGDIVRDLETGLDWQRCSIGQTWNGTTCLGDATSLPWDEAVAAAANGFSLPSVSQLRSLVYCSSTGAYDSNGDDFPFCKQKTAYEIPTINQEAFPNTTVFSFHWSATEGSLEGDAWFVDFFFGGAGQDLAFFPHYARLVRESVVTNYDLTVTVQGEGSVSSSPAGIDCGVDCSATYSEFTQVTLTAAAAEGYEFSSWAGCTSETNSCTVTMDAAKSVTATFTEIVVAPPSSEAGYIIDNRYEVLEDTSTVLDLVTGHIWKRCAEGQTWDNATANCLSNPQGYTFPEALAQAEGTEFTIPTLGELRTIVYCGPERGYGVPDAVSPCLSEDPQPNINEEAFPNSADFVVPPYWTNTGSEGVYDRLDFWNGSEGTANQTVASAVRLVKSAPPVIYELSVLAAGDGSGAVISEPAGINCGETCTFEFESTLAMPLQVTLTATPTPGTNSKFVGWEGCTSDTNTCTVTMDAAKSVTARFEIDYPIEINSRYEIIVDGSIVRDKVTGDEWQRCSVGQTWSNGTCTDTENAQKFDWYAASALTAEEDFVLPTRDQLRQIIYCSNTGTYDSNGTDAACSSSFSGYDVPTINTTAFPNTPTRDFGLYWSATQNEVDSNQAWFASFVVGGIDVTDIEPVETNQAFARLVRAGEPNNFELSVSKEGPGTGAVVSVNANGGETGEIDCGETCLASFPGNSLVTLVAMPDAGMEFTEWAGCTAITAENACSVRIDELNQVTATFDIYFPVVPGEEIDGRYVVQDDPSLVLDKVTGLVWQRCSVGQTWENGGCAGDATSFSSGADARNVTAEGGFVAPSISHLATLVYCSTTNSYGIDLDSKECEIPSGNTQPTINTLAFPMTYIPNSDTPIYNYWSRDADPVIGGRTQSVNFQVAEIGSYSAGIAAVRLVKPVRFELTVARNGSGVVESTNSTDPFAESIACGVGSDAVCSSAFEKDSGVELTATPAVGYTFTGWSGCGEASLGTCTVTIDGAKTVTANFAVQVFTVTFLDYNDTVLKTQLVNYNNSATAPEAPNREGFVFIGWDKDFSAVISDLSIKAQYLALPVGEDLETTIDMRTEALLQPSISNAIDSTVLEIVASPLNGNVEVDGLAMIYTPYEDFSGTETFTYRVLNGEYGSDIYRVTVVVNFVNRAPIANDDVFIVNYNDEQTYALDVLANDEDPDGHSLGITVEPISNSIGTLNVIDGIVYFTSQPGSRFNGRFEFNYSIVDEYDGLDQATVIVVIRKESDDDAPYIEEPELLRVNATGLLTRIPLTPPLAYDVNSNPVTVTAVDPNNRFKPGRNTVNWRAVDSEGRESFVTQDVWVDPLISIERDKTVQIGSGVTTSVDVLVSLNGEAPEYPIEIDYEIENLFEQDQPSTVSKLEIISGTEARITHTVVNFGIPDEGGMSRVSLAGEGNFANRKRSDVSFTRETPIPMLDAVIRDYETKERVTTVEVDSPVQFSFITGSNFDPSQFEGTLKVILNQDSYDYGAFENQYEWLNDGYYPIYDTSLASSDPSSFGFELTLTERSGEQRVFVYSPEVRVVAALPELGSEDSNGDGIPDNIQGHKDSDGDGIPDYLDLNMPCNVIQQQVAQRNRYLVETEPGTCIRRGRVSMESESGAIQVQGTSVPGLVNEDQEYLNAGGVFDFTITNIGRAGNSAFVVLPQRGTLPSNAVYRKYINDAWQDFVIDENNAVYSALGEPGICPAVASSAWQPGLQEGHYCVQLKLEDGGPNDADGKVDGNIEDPGGLAVRDTGNIAPTASDLSLTLRWNLEHEIEVLGTASDEDGDPLRVIAATAALGEVTVIDQQFLLFVPPENFAGTSSIAYTVSDGEGGIGEGVITIEVVTNLPPVAETDFASTDDRTPIEIDVLANDFDEEGHYLSVVGASAQQGSVEVLGNQRIRYTPRVGFGGVDVITYTVEDELGAQASGRAEVSLAVVETIVINGKTSRGSWSMELMLLLALVWLYRQGLVRTVWRRGGGVALSLMFVGLLMVQPVAVAAGTGWGFEIGAGYGSTEKRRADIEAALPAGATLERYKYRDYAQFAQVDLRFAEGWTASVGYVDLGSGDMRVRVDTTMPEQAFVLAERELPVRGSGVTFGLQRQFAVSERWQLGAEVGVFDWLSKRRSVSSDGNRLGTREAGADMFYGVNMGYQFHEQTALKLRWRSYELDDALSTLTLSLNFQF